MIIRATDPKGIKQLLELDNLGKDMWENQDFGEPLINDSLWYLPILKTTENGNQDIVGIGIAQWLGLKLIMWHIGILKKHRGPDSIKYGKELFDYINDKDPEIKHIVIVPEYTPAVKFAERMGFEEKYRIKKSVLKNNKLYDRIFMELNTSGTI